MNLDDFRRWSHRASDWAADYYATLRERPVRAQTGPGAIGAQIPDAPPLQAESMETIFADFEQCPVVGNERGLCVACRFRIVKIPFVVSLQAHRKLVEVFSNLVVIVKAFDIVDFLVSIEIGYIFSVASKEKKEPIASFTS